MMTLLYKEIRLAAHPSLFLFLGMGALTLVPAYPYGVVFFFGCLGIFQTFINARENKDAFFTAALPVNKRDVVRTATADGALRPVAGGAAAERQPGGNRGERGVFRLWAADLRGV